MTGRLLYSEYPRMSGSALLGSEPSLGSPDTAWILFQLCFIKAWLWGCHQVLSCQLVVIHYPGSQEAPGSSQNPLCLKTPSVRHPKGKARLA